MKTAKILLFCITCLLIGVCNISCNDDDYADITLSYPDESIIFDNDKRSLSISPFGSEITLVIKGGDGEYLLDNSNSEVISVSRDGNNFTIKPLTLGSSGIYIKDNSANSYVLSVEVAYYKTIYQVFANKALIEGEALTEDEKEKLEKEILGAIPVKPEGKYVFIHNTAEYNVGSVEIYKPDTTKPIEGEFQAEEVEDGETYWYQYIIKAGKAEYVYKLKDYSFPELRESPPREYWMFEEDVTDTYKKRYSALEKAYAIQGIEWQRSQ